MGEFKPENPNSPHLSTGDNDVIIIRENISFLALKYGFNIQGLDT